MTDQQNQEKKPPNELSPICKTIPTLTLNERAELTKLVGTVFDVQKQYGKTTEQIENITSGFLWALAKYPMPQIKEGFRQYILTKSDMPTPADIRAIIDPIKQEPIPDKGYYIKLQNLLKVDGPYALNDEERKYIVWYEEQMRKGLV